MSQDIRTPYSSAALGSNSSYPRFKIIQDLKFEYKRHTGIFQILALAAIVYNQFETSEVPRMLFKKLQSIISFGLAGSRRFWADYEAKQALTYLNIQCCFLPLVQACQRLVRDWTRLDRQCPFGMPLSICPSLKPRSSNSLLKLVDVKLMLHKFRRCLVAIVLNPVLN